MLPYTEYSETYVKQPLSKIDKTKILMTNGSLMKVESGRFTQFLLYVPPLKSILQYVRPSLSYHLLLRSLFCLFISGRFTQVLLFVKYMYID